MKKIQLSIIACFFVMNLTAQDKNEINNFLDQWHRAAAEADANIYFGSMADSSIYIGTDATERWTKQAFWEFSKPYFDKGKAWNFKPYDRQLHVDQSGNVTWFSELLDTWMGVCRGSGIVEKINGQWKIRQYHLSVTVPNDNMPEFLELMKLDSDN